MQLSVAVRITVAVCATLIVLGVVAALVITGAPIDAWAILTGAGALLGGLLYGVGAAGGPAPTPSRSTAPETPRPRSGAGPALLFLVAAGLAASASGCGARCQTEQAIVSALDVGVEASANAVGPDAGEDWDLALRVARGATDLGRAAVGACGLARDGAGWQSWVLLALEAAGGLVGLITGAADPTDVDLPPELAQAIELLEVEATP